MHFFRNKQQILGDIQSVVQDCDGESSDDYAKRLLDKERLLDQDDYPEEEIALLRMVT